MTPSDQSVIEIELQHPIPFGAESIAVLRIRSPKARDYRAIKQDAGPIGMVLALTAALSGVPERFLDELDGVDDLPRVLEVVGGFLDKFQATGQTS